MPRVSRVRFEYKDDLEWIRVVDVFPDQHRYLYFETSIQGVCSLLRPPIPTLEYVGLMALGARILRSHPRKILIGGLGACTLNHAFQAWWGKHSHIVTIEANPRIVTLGHRFFRLSAQQEVIVADFRDALEKEDTHRLDLITVDCYSSVSIPHHLTTLEFMFLLNQKLTNGGLAVFNLWSPTCNRLCIDQIRTMLEAFEEVAVLACRQDENFVVFAGRNRRHWPDYLDFKGMKYPLPLISKNKPNSWPDYLADSRIIDDRNVNHLFESAGYSF